MGTSSGPLKDLIRDLNRDLIRDLILDLIRDLIQDPNGASSGPIGTATPGNLRNLGIRGGTAPNLSPNACGSPSSNETPTQCPSPRLPSTRWPFKRWPSRPPPFFSHHRTASPAHRFALTLRPSWLCSQGKLCRRLSTASQALAFNSFESQWSMRRVLRPMASTFTFNIPRIQIARLPSSCAKVAWQASLPRLGCDRNSAHQNPVSRSQRSLRLRANFLAQ